MKSAEITNTHIIIQKRFAKNVLKAFILLIICFFTLLVIEGSHFPIGWSKFTVNHIVLIVSCCTLVVCAEKITGYFIKSNDKKQIYLNLIFSALVGARLFGNICYPNMQDGEVIYATIYAVIAGAASFAAACLFNYLGEKIKSRHKQSVNESEKEKSDCIVIQKSALKNFGKSVAKALFLAVIGYCAFEMTRQHEYVSQGMTPDSVLFNVILLISRSAVVICAVKIIESFVKLKNYIKIPLDLLLSTFVTSCLYYDIATAIEMPAVNFIEYDMQRILTGHIIFGVCVFAATVTFDIFRNKFKAKKQQNTEISENQKNSAITDSHLQKTDKLKRNIVHI